MAEGSVTTWTVDTFRRNELPLRSELHLAGTAPKNIILYPKPRSKSADATSSHRRFSVHKL